jgi:hydrogenase/urease accessory protein HupE
MVEARLPWLGVSADIPTLSPIRSEIGQEAGKGLVATNHAEIVELVQSRLTLKADGITLTTTNENAVALTEKGDAVHVSLTYSYRNVRGEALPPPQNLTVSARLFPSDPNHKTLLKVYRGREGDTLERETILTFLAPEALHQVGGGMSIWEVVRQFIREGIHHIFIGPDHILFVIGLLLAGGSLGRLLKVVTGFTIAHSITLTLAALGIFMPPSRLIESVIALSIVVIGVEAIRCLPPPPSVARSLEAPPASKDYRPYYAFGFGLIHGFGFANVLAELDLPRYALGWSLVSFNIGVEIGQACIIALTLPLLALVRHRTRDKGRMVILLGAVGICIIGTLWFIERLFAAP